MIAGRYRLDEQIGSGAMGIVWRATDLELGRVVALKQSQDGDNGQIRREARIGAGLHHANVITVFDTVVDDARRWLVMEYMPSRNLSSILDETGPLPPATVARIGAQLANALAAMHELDMVHRDVKPGNVLVSDKGVAKLTDLGIARWADVTATGGSQMVGTPGYLAPEVVDGHEATSASDVYSLGATLFAAIEGISPTGNGEHGPFAQMRRAANSELEPLRNAGPLEPVVQRMLHKDMAKRPTARAVKAMLDGIAGDTEPLQPLPRKRMIKRRRVIAIGAAAVALAAVVAGTVYIIDRPEPAVMTGNVGDPRTADPCALINIGSANRFGTIFTLDSEYGAFMRCGVLIRQSGDEQDLIDARVELTLPDEFPSQPHVKGKLSDIERPPEKNNECKRTILLSDEKMLTIAATHKKKRPAPLCAVAEAMANDAYATLSRGTIPRRKDAFPPNSLGSMKACDMLTPGEVAEIAAVPGYQADKLQPEPDLGNWACWWGDDPVEADVAFHRDYPLVPAEEADEDTLYLKVSGRDAYQETGKSGDDQHDFCEITVVYRDYEKDVAWNKEWQETVKVTLETQEKITEDQLCAKTVKLTERVVARLPKG